MKYIVYLTINTVNNKIYIGVHETENPNIFDGYLGCGANVNKPSSYNKGKTHLHNAILKYGVSKFYRITIKEFDNLEDALKLELELVNEEFVKRSDTYNMVIGGGFPPKLTKEIYQFSLNGILIKKWDSIIEITKHYKINKDRITMVISDKRSFDNCYWSELDIINVNEYRISKRGYVKQYNKLGEFMNEFKNITEAANKLDLDRQAITNAVYNRCTYSGYYFLKSEDNIQDLFYEKENNIKLNTTKVYRYTLDGMFDKEYNSLKEAILDTPKTSTGNINRAIKHSRTSGGYKWSYEKNDVLQSYVERTPVKVAQYDLEHNLIKIWDSVAECKKEFPSVQKVCRKERKSTNNFIFEYIS